MTTSNMTAASMQTTQSVHSRANLKTLLSVRKKTLLPLLAILLVYGCATGVDSTKREGEPFPDVATPDEMVARAVRDGKKTTIVASWYGPDFHGKRTASGEVYDMHSHTAAHKNLPFGTILHVKNPKNGKTTKVTINDRGPFIPGRDLDLSYRAAMELGIVEPGTGVIEYTVLGRDIAYVKYIKIAEDTLKAGPYTIQIAAFKEHDNAERLRKALELEYTGVYIQRTIVNGDTFYRVRVGMYKDKEKAIGFAKTLANEGYETIVLNYKT